jgi:hypothetical protein
MSTYTSEIFTDRIILVTIHKPIKTRIESGTYIVMSYLRKKGKFTRGNLVMLVRNLNFKNIMTSMRLLLHKTPSTLRFIGHSGQWTLRTIVCYLFYYFYSLFILHLPEQLTADDKYTGDNEQG